MRPLAFGTSQDNAGTAATRLASLLRERWHGAPGNHPAQVHQA